MRLEARPDNVDRVDEWLWTSNPFAGKRELQGLKVLMALMENWDLKDSNNRILAVKNGGRTELQYIVSDLELRLVKLGAGRRWPLSRVSGSRNEPEDYVGDGLLTGSGATTLS